MPLARMTFGKKLHEERNNIEVEVEQKLMKLMLDIVQALLKVKGRYTKYHPNSIA